MPSAVWQDFCSLLRDPPPLSASRRLNRPYFWGSLGGHCTSLGLSKGSKTAQEGHPGRQHGPTCLQNGPRWLQEGPGWSLTAQDGLKRAEKAPHDGFRGVREEPPEGPKRQKPMVFLRFFIGFWILTFLGFRQLKTAQEASRIAPRGPNRAPK